MAGAHTRRARALQQLGVFGRACGDSAHDEPWFQARQWACMEVLWSLVIHKDTKQDVILCVQYRVMAGTRRGSCCRHV